MRDLVVKNVDDRTYKALEKRAEAEGRRLDEWLLRKLELEAARVDPSIVTQPTPEEVKRRVAAAARIRAMTPHPLDLDSTEFIRADRDRR